MGLDMRSIAAAAFVLGLGGAALAQKASDLDRQNGIVRADAGSAAPGPAANFIGGVSVRPIIRPNAPGRTSVSSVTFAPGARSNWHTHPAGQALVVTEGCGWTQREGGPVIRICQGDTAYVPPGVRHWHGATATTGMTHLSITETVDGRNVDWMEPVAAEQYRGPAESRD